MSSEVTGSQALAGEPPQGQQLLIGEPTGADKQIQQGSAGGGQEPDTPTKADAVKLLPKRSKVRVALLRDCWLGAVGDVVLLDAEIAGAAAELGAVDDHPEAVKAAYKAKQRS